MATPGGVVYRLARVTDLPAVMDINHDVYDGFDYIPANFRPFVQARRDFFVFVCEFNGEIVSLVTFDAQVDDGIVTGGSGRTKAGFPGRGFFHGLREYGMNYVRKLYPKRDLSACGVAILSPFWKKDIARGHRIPVHQRRILRYKVTRNTLSNQLKPENHPPLNTVQASTAPLADDTAFIQQLMALMAANNPARVYIETANFVVRIVNAANVRRLLREYPCAVTMTTPTNVRTFSYSHVHQVAYGVVCQLYVYGGEEGSVFQHVLYHLYRHRAVIGGNNLGLRFSFDVNLDWEAVDDLMARLGFSRDTAYNTETERVIFKLPESVSKL